jgi:hypothetical protein
MYFNPVRVPMKIVPRATFGTCAVGCRRLTYTFRSIAERNKLDRKYKGAVKKLLVMWGVHSEFDRPALLNISLLGSKLRC